MGAGSFPGVKRPGREVHHQSTQRKIQEEFNVQRHRCENPKSLFHCPFDLTDRRTQISGFRRDVDEICALLGYYAASTGNLLPTFRDNLSAPIFKGQEVQEDGTDTLS